MVWDIKLGDDFLDYRIESLVGSGTSGQVYKVSKDGTIFALKILAVDGVQKFDSERFSRETTIAARFNNPHLLKTFNFGIHHGLPYIVMEYFDGQDLSVILKQKKLNSNEICNLGLALASALGAAHTLRVIHRDVKPGNVLLDSSFQVKLIDFGLAGDSDEMNESNLNSIVGSAVYASPEQLGFRHGRVDERSDFYSLGVLLYEAATGEVPAITEDLNDAIKYFKLEKIPLVSEKNPTLSPSLSQIIYKLMQIDPAKRYQSSVGIVQDLKKVSEFDSAFLQGNTYHLAQHDVRWTGKTELAGREQELLLLKKNLNTALSGMGRGLLIEGEPGVGKSRLAKELIQEARSKQKLILSGKCSLQEKNNAFAVFRKILDNLLNQLQSQENIEAVEKLRKSFEKSSRGFEYLLYTINPEFITYLGDKNFSKSSLDAESLLNSYFVFIMEFAKAEEGIVLFVDDIQWADSNSISLIKKIIHSMAELPILLLFTGRNNVESIQDLNHFEETVSSQRLVRYSLQPLTPNACVDIINDHLGNMPVAPELQNKLVEFSSGNPFLLIENLNRLAASGFLFIENNKWSVLEQNLKSLGLSDNVFELILRKLDSLPRYEFGFLQKFSLYGSTSNVKNLSILTGEPVANVENCLEGAVSLGCLDRLESGQYQFSHDRVREALNSTITKVLSGEIYELFARNSYGNLDENQKKNTTTVLIDLARFVLHTRYDADKAFTIKCIYAAGSRLNQEFSFKESASIFEKVAKLLHSPAIDLQLRFNFLCEFSRALIEVGQTAKANELLTIAQPMAVSLTDSTLVNYLRIEALQALGKGVAIWKIGHEVMRDHRIPVPSNNFVLTLKNIWLLIRFLSAKQDYSAAKISASTSENELNQMLASVLNRTILSGIFTQTKKMPLLYFLLQYHICANSLGMSLDLIKAKGWIAGLLLGFGGRFQKFVNREMENCDHIAKHLKTKQAAGLLEFYYANVTERMGEIRKSEKIFLNGVENYGSYVLSVDYMSMWLPLVLQYVNRGNARAALGCIDRYSPRTINENRVGSVQAIRCAQVLSLISLGRFEHAEPIFLEAAQAIKGFEPGFIYHQIHFVGLKIFWELEQPGKFPEIDKIINKFLNYQYDFNQISIYYVAIGHLRIQAIEAELDLQKKQIKIELFKSEINLLKKRIKDLICAVHVLIFESALERFQGNESKVDRLLTEAQVLADERDTDYARYCINLERARSAKSFKKVDYIELYAKKAADIATKNNWEARANKIVQDFSLVVSESNSNSSSLQMGSSNANLIDSLLKISLSASSQLDSQVQIKISLDEIISVMNAERSYLFLKNEEGELNFGGGRDSNKIDLDAPVGYSSTVVNKVFVELKPIVVIGNDQMGALGSQSAVLHGLRSILAAPLLFKGNCIGVLYVDSSLSKCQFSEGDVSILSAIAVQIAIAIENLKMLKGEVQKKELEKEMELTAKVQSMLLPKQTTFENDNFKICGFLRSAVQCGGDWWWYDYRNEVLSLFVGDFTGHGAGPAMLTSYVSACFDLCKKNDGTIKFDDFLPQLNQLILKTTQGEYLLSGIAIEVDWNKMQLKVWNCGSPGILFFGKKTAVETICPRSSLVGVDEFEVEKFESSFSRGDRIFIATDGLWEMSNVQGRTLGESQVRKLIDTTRQLGAEDSLKQFIAKVDEFHVGKLQEDDITMVYLESKELSSKSE